MPNPRINPAADGKNAPNLSRLRQLKGSLFRGPLTHLALSRLGRFSFVFAFAVFKLTWSLGVQMASPSCSHLKSVCPTLKFKANNSVGASSFRLGIIAGRPAIDSVGFNRASKFEGNRFFESSFLTWVALGPGDGSPRNQLYQDILHRSNGALRPHDRQG